MSTSIAKVAGSDGHTLVIYDRPIIPLEIKKVVDGQELETSGYTFSAQLTLEGSPMKSYDTVGQGTAADITNGAGIIEFKLGSYTSKTIYVPWGTVVEVSENEYSQFAVETSSQNNVIDEDTENACIYKCSVEQEDTITFTNQNVRLTVTKEVTGSEDDKTKPFTFTLSGLSAGKIYRFNVAGSNVTRTASSEGTVSFELKHGQTADFANQHETGSTLTVRETAPSDGLTYTTTWNVVDNNNSANVLKSGTGTATDSFTLLDPRNASARANLQANFVNTPSVAPLSVTKKVVDESGATITPTEDFTFNIKVNVGQGATAYDLAYTVGGQSKTATGGNFTLKAGQTATFTRRSAISSTAARSRRSPARRAFLPRSAHPTP